MGGLITPNEIESNLSSNRLYQNYFTAYNVPKTSDKRWQFKIPRKIIGCRGFVFLVGCSINSAPNHWRLGCTVQYASYSSPDSTVILDPDAINLIRVEERKQCILNSYTLCIWPDLNAQQTCLIIDFPHWLMDATIEIFWYNGEYETNFFSKLRESLTGIFGDAAYLDNNLGEYINSRVQISLADHVVNENAHNQYLKSDEASQIYLKLSKLDAAIADSNALSIALDPYLLKSQANLTFVPKETFEQERTFTDEAVQEAKDIAAADLASHVAASNPHNISPEAIGALEEGFRSHTHDEKYAAIEHSHDEINPQGNLQVNSLTLSQPLGILGGGTGASTAAAASHTQTGAQIYGNISGNAANITGIAAIANGGTGASTAAAALTNLGAAAINHPHNIAQISDIGTTANSISLGNNFKIGWGISDNQWLDYGSLNTIWKNIDTSSAGFSKPPIYFTSIYGNSSHWMSLGHSSIYAPTANGFIIHITIPNHENRYIITPSLAAQYNWRIAWLGIQAG